MKSSKSLLGCYNTNALHDSTACLAGCCLKGTWSTVMLVLPYIQKDFQESRPLICKEEFLTPGCPEKKDAGKGLVCLAADTALAGSRNFTRRRGQMKTCKEGRLFCLDAHSSSTAMPALLLLPAFYISMPWTQTCLLFPLVSCRATQHLQL